MFVDTHAHLFYPNFKDDLDDVLNRAKEESVDYILIPATDINTAKEVISLTEKYDFLYGAVGVHPHDSKDWEKSWTEEIRKFAANKKIKAIGEIGLDYYYDFSPVEKQKQAFRDQIELAIGLNMPIVVHTRESDDDIYGIIKSYKSSNLKAQFHCFSGNKEQAKQLLDLGHYISFTGNITFKKADELREVVKYIPLNRLMIETDSPFLTPVPNRGKRNESAYVKLIAEEISKIHNISIEEVGKATSYNAYKFFGIGEMPKVSFTYQLNGNLYINITNRCNSSCYFCEREGEAVLKGYNLSMKKNEEPGAEVYIKEIGDPKKYKEIIYCGYGEPTIRWDVVKEISKYVKENGGTTRLNTDGHGNVINKKDITPEMKGLIDIVSISLNSADPEQYAKIMGIDVAMFDETKNFVMKAKQFVKEVVLTIVQVDEIDIEKARKFTEEKLGVTFRERPYFG
ncbi:MAG: radical SAM protein [Ignavibacteriales bacterium CG_4_9_14_3_um_filter_30_11]|nr:MAG: radical SAM protein [Ignavibacteriales bacterium CG_4_9_14_3_um_filter_30_11]